MHRRRGAGSPHSRAAGNSLRWFLFAVLSLVVCWATCFAALTIQWHSHGDFLERQVRSQVRTGNLNEKQPDVPVTEDSLQKSIINLSRSGRVIATADVRGNLGPVDVVVQSHPGTDWIHDRWQAASDMRGTAIKGVHWIVLDFGVEVVPEKIVLDWEAAYSDKYRLEASLSPFSNEPKTSSKQEHESFWAIFDSTDPVQKATIQVERAGQSPGVKTKTPLHVIHTLHPLQSSKPFRYLRLYILGSAMGWGVSLWQFDVFGYSME